MPVTTVVRWAGSKKKLLPLLTDRAPKSFKRYYEPFCGSASLFCHLEPDKAVLGDINPELINALRVIRYNKDIYDALISLPISEAQYYSFRKQDPNALDCNERAVRFLYLNRFCFNGVYRTNKLGQFNVPMGASTGNFPSRASFDAFAATLQHADIRIGAFTDTLEDAGVGDFAYLDPPFTKHGTSFGEYGPGSFTDKNFQELISTLTDLDVRGVRFLLSYKSSDELEDALRPRFEIERLEVNRHVAGFKQAWSKASEVLVRNYE